MDELAEELDLRVDKREHGRNYRPRTNEPAGTSRKPIRSGVGVYWTPGPQPRVEFNLEPFRDLGRDDLADEIRRRIRSVTGQGTSSYAVSVPPEQLLENWPRTRDQVMVPYFEARAELQAESTGSS